MKKSSYVWGIMLIIIGGILLYDNIFDAHLFGWSTLWPMFVLGLGLSFEFSFFINRKAPGLLVPGGILTTNGIVFFFQTFTKWHFIGYTWPLFILSVAIGLFQLYWFIGRPKGLLVTIIILSAVAFISLTCTLLSGINEFGIIFPLALIGAGVYILFFRKTSA